MFCIGNWRPEGYSFCLAITQSSVYRSSRSPPAQLLLTIPVYRHREDVDGVVPSWVGGPLQQLHLQQQQQQQQQQQINCPQERPHRRRRLQLCLAVGLRKLGLLEGRHVIWSCYRGEVAELRVVRDCSSSSSSSSSNYTVFLRVLHFRTRGNRPPPDDGLTRQTREGLRQRAELVSCCCC